MPLVYGWGEIFKLQKYCIIILIFLLPVIRANAAHKSVLVVQSAKIAPYSAAVEGFKSTCRCTVRELVLSEAEGLNIFREIRSSQPDVIFAVGGNALQGLKAIKDIPIVYAMISNPESIPFAGANVTGVSMNISPEKQLALLREAFPDLHRIGLLYNPLKYGRFVEKAVAASRAMQMKILTREVRNAKDVPMKINSLKDKIDVYWMIPDSTVLSPDTIEYLFLFTCENKIPILTFAEKYLSMGAVMSVNINARDIGKQAGEMAEKILSGADVSDVPGVDAREADVAVNLITARKMGRPINKEILRRGKVID